MRAACERYEISSARSSGAKSLRSTAYLLADVVFSGSMTTPGSTSIPIVDLDTGAVVARIDVDCAGEAALYAKLAGDLAVLDEDEFRKGWGIDDRVRITEPDPQRRPGKSLRQIGSSLRAATSALIRRFKRE